MLGRGHVPTLFLIVVALVLCTSALFSFATFSRGEEELADSFDSFIERDVRSNSYINALFEGIVWQAYVDSGSVLNAEFEQHVQTRAAAVSERVVLESNLLLKLRTGDYTLGEDSITVQDVSLRSKTDVFESSWNGDLVFRFK